MFRVTYVSNQTSIKYPGATASTSKVHINNVYITYTFVHFAGLLIRQIFGAISLLVPSALAVKTLSIRLRAGLGLLLRHGNSFAALLEVTLWLAFLAFLETRGFINHQHLMLLFDFHFSSFEH